MGLDLSRVRLLMQAAKTYEPLQPATERKAIWVRNKATLWYYPATEKKYGIPIYLIYSLVNQPTILDLLPDSSFIGALVQAGYDVYLIDFGIPGYEDRDMRLGDYIHQYIQPGVVQALTHSGSSHISVMGFCLGGTLATIYASLAQEPIRNLILSVTPIDFSRENFYPAWSHALAKDPALLNDWIDSLGLIPAKMMWAGVRLLTSPVYISPYLALLQKGHDEAYRERWTYFQQWTRDHIPFPGAALKEFVHELLIGNKLASGELLINGEPVRLQRIKANLLSVASEFDELVPIEQASPIISLVSSEDKEFKTLPVGHTSVSSKNSIETYLNWLARRSDPIT